jgi:hypothetical protein
MKQIYWFSCVPIRVLCMVIGVVFFSHCSFHFRIARGYRSCLCCWLAMLQCLIIPSLLVAICTCQQIRHHFHQWIDGLKQVNMWFDDYIKKIKSHVKVNLNRDKESLMNLNLNLLQRIRFFVHGTIPKPTRTITSTKITSSMPIKQHRNPSNI